MDDALDAAFDAHPDLGELRTAVLLKVDKAGADVVLSDGEHVTLKGSALRPLQGLARGAVLRVLDTAPGKAENWQLSQTPQAEGAVVTLDPVTGRHPLAGGRLRLHAQPVQLRHPGLPPAGLGLQALHLLGADRAGRLGRHAGERPALRAGRLVAAQLRRPVRRGADAAPGPGQVQEHGHHPHRPGAGPAARPCLGRALRHRRGQAAAEPDARLGHWRRHAAADGAGLCRLCGCACAAAASSRPASAAPVLVVMLARPPLAGEDRAISAGSPPRPRARPAPAALWPQRRGGSAARRTPRACPTRRAPGRPGPRRRAACRS